MIAYKEKPFFLKDEDIRWVEETYDGMSLEERIGQLFCPIVFTKEESELSEFIKSYHPGGVLYREGPAEELRRAHQFLQSNSPVPLLLAANLEYGGNGSPAEGTYYGRQMLVAATGKEKRAYELGRVSCSEAASVGINWSFAPVVDIDRNCLNPITNVRTFGTDIEQIIKMAAAYIRAAREEGVATAVKHFPGDGIDDRDQHLLTSVNSLSVQDWEDSFGKIYRGMIEAGTLSIMAGHIALPSFEKKYDGQAPGKMIPATLSKNLLQGLLRRELGFNGLITSDATPMVGFCTAMERKKAVPLSIEYGCDVFLFNKSLPEDFSYMLAGFREGLLSTERLKEAVKRILATKAALGLHRKKEENALIPPKEAMSVIGCGEHLVLARECADEGVTLVKDRDRFLPLSPASHKRVLLEIIGNFSSNERVAREVTKKLTEEGFSVTLYKPEGFEALKEGVEDFKKKYDWVLYIANVETASNQTVARLQWHTMFGLGNNLPWMVREMPTIFISLGNPYHLLDAPMVGAYINGYCNSCHVIEACIEKMLGKSPFKGKSPVDPFCGRIDLPL